MFEHRDPAGTSFVTYELNAEDFELHEGDTVAPGFEIGIDIRSGFPIWLDGWSRIATVYYNPMHDSFLVMLFRFQPEEPEISLKGIDSLVTA